MTFQGGLFFRPGNPSGGTRQAPIRRPSGAHQETPRSPYTRKWIFISCPCTYVGNQSTSLSIGARNSNAYSTVFQEMLYISHGMYCNESMYSYQYSINT